MTRPTYEVRKTGDPERDTFPWSVVQVSEDGELLVNSYTHMQVAEEVAHAYAQGWEGLRHLDPADLTEAQEHVIT